MQPPPFFLLFSRAARVAASNTSLTPSFVFAEHSKYSLAPVKFENKLINTNRVKFT